MNARELARYFAAAKRDRSGNFREHFRLATGKSVLCESRSEYKLWSDLTEAMESGAIDMNRVSIRGLFEAFIPGGREVVESWGEGGRYTGGGISLNQVLQEDAGAVTADQFSNITGQIVYNRILQGFAAEEYVFSKIIPNVPTQFNGERIAGVSRIGDEAQVVPEGRPYPQVGMSEDYIDTPQTLKRGMIDALTKEAIFFDRTGVILARAGEVGEFLGLNKEKRLIDAFIDKNTTAHQYNWRGTTYATYQASTPWINVKTSNGLADWTNVDAAEQIFQNITDPWTGEPIMIQPKDLVVTRQNLYVARRIVNATNIQVVTPGFATSGSPSKTDTQNPIQDYRIISSALLKARMALASEATTDWFIGDVAEAINYMENFPLTVVQAPVNSQAEFERDIVMQWKASERGAAAVVEPRRLVRSSA